MESQQLFGVESIKQFILGGNATITVKNVDTGNRFTYKIRQPKVDSPHFVSLLTGSNNESDYTFLGSIFKEMNYKHGRKSPVGYEATSAKAFTWLWGRLSSNQELPAQIEVWHEGRCARCGRKLTTPESLQLGWGPDCASQIGL